MTATPARMRASDLVGLALSALGRQKARTALTVLGVAIGTFALIASLAIGRGVDRAIVGLFRGTDALRQVGLYVRYEGTGDGTRRAEPAGTMSDAKRARLRRALARQRDDRGARMPKAKLDRAGLDRLAALPHVERVVPLFMHRGTAGVEGLGAPCEAWFSSADPDASYRARIIAGRPLAGDSAREAVVHEFLLYQLGLVGDEDIGRALGRPIRLEYRVERASEGYWSLANVLTFGPKSLTRPEAEAVVRALKRLGTLARFLPIPPEERAALLKLLGRLPAAPEAIRQDVYAETFTVVGVVREASEQDAKQAVGLFPYQGRDADVLLPARAAADFALRAPPMAENGLDQAALTVDADANVKAVAKEVEAMGFQSTSLVQVIETIRLNVVLITCATAFIAAVALAVAAIGIANTMVMSVLERTHEIGIMKALGARTGQVRAIFLVEGVAIGLVGGGLGLGLAWGLSYPGDSIAKSIMQAQSPRPVEGSLFDFSPWLVLGAPLLAALVTMLAAVYPAHRAAKVDPITSLRHE